MSYLTVNNKPLPLQPDYSCFRMLHAGAYSTPPDPQICLGLMDEICVGLRLDFAIFSTFSFIFCLFLGQLCVLWLYAVQIWGWRNDSILPWTGVLELPLNQVISCRAETGSEMAGQNRINTGLNRWGSHIPQASGSMAVSGWWLCVYTGSHM